MIAVSIYAITSIQNRLPSMWSFADERDVEEKNVKSLILKTLLVSCQLNNVPQNIPQIALIFAEGAKYISVYLRNPPGRTGLREVERTLLS